MVIAGKDKGTTGTVERIDHEANTVVVSGVNTRVKHRKARGGNAAERVEAAAPIDASNVALIDPESGKPTRVGATTDQKGTKKRISKKSGKEI